MILFLKKVQVFSYALILILGDTSISSPNGFVDWEKKTTVMVTNGDLSVLFRDNSASPEILSGIQSLFNRKDASYFDAYDPDTKGASVGMNFEHIISGHKSPFNKFTPRQGKYDLFQLPDRNSVMLIRNRKDSPWDVSSALAYKMKIPHYINKVEEEKEYGFKVRLVWKRFISAQDCLREYEKWHSETTISEN